MPENEVSQKNGKATKLKPVPAVTRTIAILRLLGRSNQGLGVKAVADELGLVPSTCLHILRVLVSEDIVRVDPGTKRYSLGSGMISLAQSVLDEDYFVQLAQPVLDRLAATYGITAVGNEITPNQNVIVLALSTSSQPFRLHIDVGSQFSSLISGTGRLIAAFSGESWEQLREKYDQIPWDNPVSFKEWKKQVELARARGWSGDQDNFINGLTAVAVPIFARDGRLTHTLVAMGLSTQLNTASMAKLAVAMKREAQAISAELYPE